jgi:hypothetical protein
MAFYTVSVVSNMKRMCDDGYKRSECELTGAKIVARVGGDTEAYSVSGTRLTRHRECSDWKIKTNKNKERMVRIPKSETWGYPMTESTIEILRA